MRYFAYGSNMDPIQMKSRCPSAKVIGVAKLPHYRLAFPVWSNTRQCAVGSIAPAAGEDVAAVQAEDPAFPPFKLSGGLVVQE